MKLDKAKLRYDPFLFWKTILDCYIHRKEDDIIRGIELNGGSLTLHGVYGSGKTHKMLTLKGADYIKCSSNVYETLKKIANVWWARKMDEERWASKIIRKKRNILLDELETIIGTEEEKFFFETMRKTISMLEGERYIIFSIADDYYEYLNKKYPQLTSRTLDVSIENFSLDETIKLIKGRLKLAREGQAEDLFPFTMECIKVIYSKSKIPREILSNCRKLLLSFTTSEVEIIDEEFAAEILGINRDKEKQKEIKRKEVEKPELPEELIKIYDVFGYSELKLDDHNKVKMPRSSFYKLIARYKEYFEETKRGKAKYYRLKSSK